MMNNLIKGLMISLAAQFFVTSIWATELHPPIEAYGNLATNRFAALSSDGSKVAFITNDAESGSEVLAIYEIGIGYTDVIDTSDVIIRNIFFSDDNHVILRAAETRRLLGTRRFKYSGAFSYNLKTKKSKQLLRKTRGIIPAQTGLGQIVGGLKGTTDLLMPAYMGVTNDKLNPPAYNLLRVNHRNGKGRVFKKGRPFTKDWFVDKDGTVLAREDYSNKNDLYQIFTFINGKAEKIYEKKDANRYPFSLIGVKADKSALILIEEDQAGGYEEMYEMSFAGKISGPILTRKDADFDAILVDANRVVQGVRYSGMHPSYHFFDPVVDKIVGDLVSRLKGSSVTIIDWSDDWKKLLLLIDSADTSGAYLWVDTTTQSISMLNQRRPTITKEAIGKVAAISYPARDGFDIPAVLTMPPGLAFDQLSNLPILVMPHGGPASYDSLQFDWMAQYFANRGYLVLQPNFRGSSGFGADFRHAGNGEWGGKMQDDVTDGVMALIKNGAADPDHTCIIGWSYGGYSALAGGAFTPDLYKCVVAIAPVSDIPKMITDVKRKHGAYHWVVDYWEELIADGSFNKAKLKQISPARHAKAFTAPVLLIHGKHDTTVPIDQSYIMQKALKRAGKSVELIKINGEDHHLSESENRLAALTAIDAFVTKHIGAPE
ncbi:MAG: S9 family peptidase [Parvularculaceae bacterium]